MKRNYFTKAIGRCLLKSFSSSGRATRSEYFIWHIFLIVLFAVEYARKPSTYIPTSGNYQFTITFFIFLFAFFPTFNLTIRRLHDTDTSGFILLMVAVGAFWFWKVSDRKSSLTQNISEHYIAFSFLFLTSLLVVYLIIFKRGNKGKNTFGLPAPLFETKQTDQVKASKQKRSK